MSGSADVPSGSRTLAFDPGRQGKPRRRHKLPQGGGADGGKRGHAGRIAPGGDGPGGARDRSPRWQIWAWPKRQAGVNVLQGYLGRIEQVGHLVFLNKAGRPDSVTGQADEGITSNTRLAE
jgi:hypothetical protein